MPFFVVPFLVMVGAALFLVSGFVSVMFLVALLTFVSCQTGEWSVDSVRFPAKDGAS